MTTRTVTHDIVPAVERISHHEGCDLAEVAYGRFADVVETLANADWDRPTDCDGWTVRHIVAHMVGAMRSAASFREMMSQQRDIKAHVKQFGGTEVDAMTQVQIDRTWEGTNSELVEECRSLVAKAAAGRRRTPAPMRRFVKFDVEMGPIKEQWTLGYLVDVILTRDAWLHRIDVCRAIGKEPLLTADHDGRIVADVVSEWARRHGQPFSLHLTGPAGGTFRSGDRGDVMEIDAVEFCRIVSGRAVGEGLLATAVPF
jgi:uncharacterized protein (TIGR03083 family)